MVAIALFKSKALLNNRSWKYISLLTIIIDTIVKRCPLGLTFQYKWNLENFLIKVFLLPVPGMYLDLDFLIVLFGILNHGLEMCCVQKGHHCITALSLASNRRWKLGTQGQLVAAPWKRREQNWNRGRGNKKQLVIGIGQAGKEVWRP